MVWSSFKVENLIMTAFLFMKLDIFRKTLVIGRTLLKLVEYISICLNFYL